MSYSLSNHIELKEERKHGQLAVFFGAQKGCGTEVMGGTDVADSSKASARVCKGNLWHNPRFLFFFMSAEEMGAVKAFTPMQIVNNFPIQNPFQMLRNGSEGMLSTSVCVKVLSKIIESTSLI